MTKITGFGNALVDVLVHLEDETLLNKLHLAKGGMTLIDEHQLAAVNASIVSLPQQRATGGSASNTIHALASLGDTVAFVGAVGDDETGRFFRQQAEERGIDIRLKTIEGVASGIATTFITPDGERTFATHLGAATQLSIDELELTSNKGDILHVEGYLVQDHDLIERALQCAKAAGMLVSFDLASWNIVAADREFIHHLVQEYVDIVFANEEEAAAYCQEGEYCGGARGTAEEALEKLAEQTMVAIVKVGKRGALGSYLGERAFAPGLIRKAIDTTAAGDFFAAGFLHGWVHGQPLDRCLDYGNRIAGEVIQVVGTQVTDKQLRQALEN